MSRRRIQLFALAMLVFFGPTVGSVRAQLTSGAPPAPASSSAGSAGKASSSSSSVAGQGQNSFSGSVPDQLAPGVLQISLQDAIDRGLKRNLGLLLSNQDIRSARGSRWEQLSSLLPNLTTSTYVDESQVSLAEFGFNFKSPLFPIPTVVGPFAYYDTRAYLTQSVFDWKAINNLRSAAQSLKSAEHSYKDSRDLVVEAVGFAYLQAIADEALIEAVDAQVKTAQALYDQAADQVQAGTSPAIDALRARVQLQTQQQQLIQAKNDFAIQKLSLARAIGLAPGQEFELNDKSPYQAFDMLTVDEALKRAYAARSDFQSALADVRAAEFSRKAAEAGYYPTLSFSANYGLAGNLPTTVAHGLFDVRGTLNIPIFQGGRVHGDVLQSDAQLAQSRDRLENLRAQIDADVRTALLNLQSSGEQVTVAMSNVDLAEQTLAQSRDRFSAGVTDSVEVVQSQQAVASAHNSYISSLYTYNSAKISLARAIGQGEEGVKEFFKGK